MIQSIATIFKRELSAYFNSAIAYIFIIVFVFLGCGLYMMQFFLIFAADMRGFFGTLPFILCIFLPAISMRLWAEERKGNTLELLLTFPMKTPALVAGKFLAGIFFYMIALLATMTIPIMLSFLGKPDFGMIAGGYIGAFFIGAFFLSLGIFISGFSRDQIVAFILTMIACFGIYLTGTDLVAATLDGWFPGLGSFLRRFLGAAMHYEAFTRGIIDIRDVLFFTMGSVLFLLLNIFWLDGRMKRGFRKTFFLAALLCLGIFISGNWFFAEIHRGRFDLTQGKIYTLSPATQKILKNLKTPVTAKFYVSSQDKMPTAMKTIEQEVVAKLDEYRIASEGKFNYKILHLDAANVAARTEKKPDEILLADKGVQPFQVQAVESDELAVRLIYSTLSLSYKEKPEEVIPRIVPSVLDNLEYTLTSKIFRLAMDQKPLIILIAPSEEKKIDPETEAALEQLGKKIPESYREDAYDVIAPGLNYEGYEILRVNLTEKEAIPPQTKTLMILEPRKLNDRQLYEINRFLVQGGSVFLAVQQYMLDYRIDGQDLSIAKENAEPQINSLLSHWGLQVDQNVLADEQNEILNVSTQMDRTPFQMGVPVKLPVHIVITASGMNPDISITSQLSPFFYLWGNALEIDQNKIRDLKLDLKILLHSSNHSWTLPGDSPRLIPEHLTENFAIKKGSFPLAVLVKGQFPDAFEGKPIPAWPKKDEDESESPEDSKFKTEINPKAEINEPIHPAPGKLILIGVATSFQKQLLQSGGHLNFLLNSLDALTLGEDLVTIRSKKPMGRTISYVSPTAKVGWRFFVTLLVPLVIALLGIVRFIFRQKGKQDYLRNLEKVYHEN